MIALVLGTRPEIIKLAPVVRACRERQSPFLLIHTGQHYSYELDGVFFAQLGLPPADESLGCGSGTHAQQTGRMLVALEQAFLKRRPDLVLVEGDTNSVLAGALAAVKLGIPVGHLEAGLRSGDRAMPEELNRIMVDHVSEFLFAPLPAAAGQLRAEGIAAERICVSGNTIADAIVENRAIAEERSTALARLRLTRCEYFLATLHRPENVDHPQRLRAILAGWEAVARHTAQEVIFPVHPRTAARLAAIDAPLTGIRTLPPVDYLDFLKLQANARLILTDSGGLQEEACILGVPCVTIRDHTERPETIELGANRLAGPDPAMIVQTCLQQLEVPRTWQHPYGDGNAAKRILHWLAARGF